MPIEGSYPEELQQVNPAKNYEKFNQVNFQQGHSVTGKLPKMKIGAIKEATPETYTHVIPLMYKYQKLAP